MPHAVGFLWYFSLFLSLFVFILCCGGVCELLGAVRGPALSEPPGLGRGPGAHGGLSGP